MIEPDISIFNRDEYTIGPEGELTDRKGFTFWGSSILIEIKLCRGCRKFNVADALYDITKLDLIRQLHYRADQPYNYFPVFAFFSRSPLADEDREAIAAHARINNVQFLWSCANP
jgi:hypothetical protein